jgi:TonB family protein
VDALDTVETKPWHALIEAEIFDAKGSNPTHGTIEIWQSGSDRRTLYTFGSTTMTEIVKGKSVYRTASDPQFPRFAPFLMAKVLHTGPTMAQVKQINPQLEHRKVDGQKFECIAMKLPPNVTASAPPAYCVDDRDHLRALFNFQQTVLLDAPEDFLGHAISRRISITNSDVPTATGNITKLEIYEPSVDQFTPTGDMSVFVPTARISGGVMGGQIVKAVQPMLPRSRSARGRVNLRVIIGRDGRPTSVEIISAPDAAIGAACAEAVKQWVYKPYLLNGDPIQVETTVLINIP